MQINVNTAMLAKLVSHAKSIVKTNRIVQISAEGANDGSVGCVTLTTFEGLTVSKWNGEAEVLRSGSIAVRLDAIERFLKASTKSDATIQLETYDVDNTESLRIITGRGAHEFDSEDEAVFNAVSTGKTNIPQGDLAPLAQAIIKAKDAAASEADVVGARSAFAGVHIQPSKDGYDVVGTDGKRMAYTNLTLASLSKSDIPDEGVTIPAKMATPILEMISDRPACIRMVENSMIVENSEGSLSFTVMNAAYPRYQALLNDNSQNRLTIQTQDLIMALDRSSVSIGQEDRFSTATLLRDADGIHVTSYTSRESSSEMISNEGGEECEISFNVGFMKRTITHAKSKISTFGFTDVSAPIFITDGDKTDVTLLVMPCKSGTGK